MKELTRIAILVRHRDHLEAAIETAEDRFRRDILEEQLHECKCAVEHAINGYSSHSQVWFNPFYATDEDLFLSLGA